MMTPLWLDVRLGRTVGNVVEVTAALARCRNCGKVKATSDPCGFDHLAAVMELHAALDGRESREAGA